MHIFMENKRLSEVSSEHHLPEELCRDILSRLPVKSLLRFRCVSKSWLSLINDPDFCLVHLENFKNNRDETHLLVVEGEPKHCVIRCSDNFETNLETLVTLPPRYGEVDWTIKCSVNGLVLLKTSYRRETSARANDLMMWNPSIRKFHVIPSLPKIETSPNSFFQEVDIGMGYDPLVKDYKHVKLVRGNANIPPLVAIYTIGDGSWKMSQFHCEKFSSFEWDFRSIHMDVVYLRGSLYFLAINWEGQVLRLISFDLTCEEFCSISLPESVEEWVRLVRYGCSSLAMFYMEDSNVFLWVLDIESMCWTKPYSLDLLVPDDILYVKKNHDILMWWSQNLAKLSVATSNRFEQWCQLVTSYNLESKEEIIKLLGKQDYDFDIWQVYGYIESLALLN